jgi:hypothetical protein
MKQTLFSRLENLEESLLPSLAEPLRIVVEFARPGEIGSGKTIEVVIPVGPSNELRPRRRNAWRRRASQ